MFKGEGSLEYTSRGEVMKIDYEVVNIQTQGYLNIGRDKKLILTGVNPAGHVLRGIGKEYRWL